jgi:ubiquinone/menaquinone biosynthesis C-methylase UbiE
MLGAKRMHTAFQTWNQSREPLESVEARIHDGVPLDRLHDRANGYLNTLFTLFPYAAPKRTDVALEIGPGVGYIMQAVMNRFAPAQIVGVDVAPAMINHAKARLERDQVDTTNWRFEAYDGVTMPFADRSIDHLYSVACLQHIPKTHVYHLFTEMVRVLKDGYAALHFLSFSFIPRQHTPFVDELKQQLSGTEGHWHHFYSKDELMHVLQAIGAADISVTEHDGSLWAVFRRPGAAPLA